MIAELEEVIRLSKLECEKQWSYPFLPDIIHGLEELQEFLALADENAATTNRFTVLRRGLGRLVTEDYSFAESELGAIITKTLYGDESD